MATRAISLAIATHELARDRRVVDFRVNFRDAVEPTDDWYAYWQRADDNGLIGVLGSTVK